MLKIICDNTSTKSYLFKIKPEKKPIGDGNVIRERSEGKLNVGENKKHLVSPNSYDARESSEARRQGPCKTSDTRRIFLARAGGEIRLIKKSEERKNPICPFEYYSTELKLRRRRPLAIVEMKGPIARHERTGWFSANIQNVSRHKLDVYSLTSARTAIFLSKPLETILPR